MVNKFFWFLFLFLFFSLNSLALEEHTKLWLGANSLQTPDPNKKWLTLFFSQLRFIDQSHPWQAALLEGGIGQALSSNESMWLGFRWTGLNPDNGFYQENRLFQQIIFKKEFLQLPPFVFRSRMEEIQRTNNPQIALRFRQRAAIELKKILFNNAFPFLYDEIFFQLNHPDYMPKNFIGENRLFIGFNLYRSKKTWWEIGYLNQYQIRTPTQRQNRMSHVLSMTYNF